MAAASQELGKIISGVSAASASEPLVIVNINPNPAAASPIVSSSDLTDKKSISEKHGPAPATSNTEVQKSVHVSEARNQFLRSLKGKILNLCIPGIDADGNPIYIYCVRRQIPDPKQNNKLRNTVLLGTSIFWNTPNALREHDHPSPIDDIGIELIIEAWEDTHFSKNTDLNNDKTIISPEESLMYHCLLQIAAKVKKYYPSLRTQANGLCSLKVDQASAQTKVAHLQANKDDEYVLEFPAECSKDGKEVAMLLGIESRHILKNIKVYTDAPSSASAPASAIAKPTAHKMISVVTARLLTKEEAALVGSIDGKQRLMERFQKDESLHISSIPYQGWTIDWTVEMLKKVTVASLPPLENIDHYVCPANMDTVVISLDLKENLDIDEKAKKEVTEIDLKYIIARLRNENRKIFFNDYAHPDLKTLAKMLDFLFWSQSQHSFEQHFIVYLLYPNDYSTKYEAIRANTLTWQKLHEFVESMNLTKISADNPLFSDIEKFLSRGTKVHRYIKLIIQRYHWASEIFKRENLIMTTEDFLWILNRDHCLKKEIGDFVVGSNGNKSNYELTLRAILNGHPNEFALFQKLYKSGGIGWPHLEELREKAITQAGLRRSATMLVHDRCICDGTKDGVFPIKLANGEKQGGCGVTVIGWRPGEEPRSVHDYSKHPKIFKSLLYPELNPNPAAMNAAASPAPLQNAASIVSSGPASAIVSAAANPPTPPILFSAQSATALGPAPPNASAASIPAAPPAPKALGTVQKRLQQSYAYNMPLPPGGSFK